MRALDFPIQILARCNTAILRLSRHLSVIALALMVVIMLLQVFFRYALNNALPWPDEAARFCMLWMTGLMAPLALRHGGFVAIDMFQQMLPRLLATILQITLWLVALIVLIVAVQIGWDHFNAGWLFKSSSMKIPAGLISERPVRMPLAYSYLSLLLSVCLMISVSVELTMRHVRQLLTGHDPLLDNPVSQGVD
ncbi:MAG: C4-dicarboxylate ABC transporter permease [Gammaproteobacteria bacterium]|nr:C4-dicarboxylate ABC transporter permease [Gammaproteobacteria bacterium]